MTSMFSVVYIGALQFDTELHQQMGGEDVRYISVDSMKLKTVSLLCSPACSVLDTT